MDTWQFKVLFDGECPFCRLEARWMGKLDRRGHLVLEDIAAPDFDATRYGVTLPELMGSLHGVFPDGRKTVGMETFRQAYRAVGLGWLLAPTGWPVLRTIFDYFYVVFARYRVGLGRLVGRGCTTDRCSVPSHREGPGVARVGATNDNRRCVMISSRPISEADMRVERYKQMTDFLVGLGTTDVEHTGTGFLAHLIGVYKDLERWGASVEVCRAGMFHSIYGTQLFQKFCLPLERRADVSNLIGQRAEWLGFLNSVMDRPHWDRIFLEETGERAVVDRLTGEKYQLSQADFDDLATIHVCDWLEQVPRSGDWDYRRAAYQAMAKYLGGIAEEECGRVYGLEAAAS